MSEVMLISFITLKREAQKLEERENAWHKIFDLALQNPQVSDA